MKKIFLLKVLFVAVIISLTSQASKAQYMSAGTRTVDAGLYLPSGFTVFKANLMYGVANNISVGGQVELASGTGSSEFGLNGRANYHFAQLMGLEDNVNIYGGVSIGKYFAEGLKDIGILGQIGGGYMFNDKIGAHAEVRFGLSKGYALTVDGSQFGLGLTFKLGQ